MAPCNTDIFQIFSKFGPHGGDFISYLDDHVKFHVTGHEHSYQGSRDGPEAVKDMFRELDFVDWTEHSMHPTKVIGGCGSEWCAVEMVSKGKAKKEGKPINNEFVYIAHFNDAGKIDVIRMYCDTAHLEDHFDHHEKK